MRELRFGDVVEWKSGWVMARWFIIDPAPNTQTGVWLGPVGRHYSPGQVSQINAHWGEHNPDGPKTDLLTEDDE